MSNWTWSTWDLDLSVDCSCGTHFHHYNHHYNDEADTVTCPECGREYVLRITLRPKEAEDGLL